MYFFSFERKMVWKKDGEFWKIDGGVINAFVMGFFILREKNRGLIQSSKL